MSKSEARPRGRWRTWGGRIALAFGLLVAILLIRTALLSPEPFDRGPQLSLPTVDPNVAAQRLSAAVAIPTISPDGTPERRKAMLDLHRYLETTFPQAHQTLSREVINELSLLYRWPGTDPDAEPILFTAHMDVVPVEPGTEGDWNHPPFSGAIEDGAIWGRGTFDDKTGVVGLMMAVEQLASAGFVPRRTLVFAFGHDEEIGGRDGAKTIAALLAERGEHFAFVLDEGGVVVVGAIPGLDPPAAVVGVAEKGFATIELSLEDEGGHASMPPPTGAIQRLAAAVGRLQDEPMPKEIRGATALMLDHMAPHMNFGPRIGLANRWLLDPVLAAVMSTKPPTLASIRTTIVPTMMNAGVAPNVLASQATVTLNARILPGDSVESVIAHIRDVVDDPDVEIECTADCWEPSHVSDVDGEGFAMVRRAVGHAFPEAVVVPNLVVGATDSRHYADVATNAYRFLPILMNLEDRVRIHGTNERISIEDFAISVKFYEAMLTLAGE